jgi:hypothetical protein
MCGCDPASAERGTIEVNTDKGSLSEQILKPPGIPVPPKAARRGAPPPSGNAAGVPSNGQ